MTAAVLILLLVTAQRLVELDIARRHTKALLARGAYEVGAGHYPLIVAVHAAWLASLWLLALERPINWLLIAAYALLQGLRIWILATLGERWTTRIIVLPGAPLIKRGPFRLLKHPNYVVVIGEIALLPLAFGLIWIALIFSLLNAAVLAIRIKAEGQGLSSSLS
jgi:methyltransferase